MKVLHVLETSTPELVGYTVRGRYIVNHQRRLGLQPLVVTSPFFRGADAHRVDEIDGVTYYRSNSIPRPDKGRGKLLAYWTRIQMMRSYREYVAEIARREKPDVIHAHSSYLNGIAAHSASHAIGVPFIYELRTLWGESAVVEDGLNPTSLKYRAVWHLELAVMKRAHRIVAISRGIRDAIVERGMDPARIDIIPNGVDTSVFVPRLPDGPLLDALGFNGCFVVGFIGSLRHLEGLGLAIEAFRDVVRRNPRARLLIVGDGPERASLEEQARAAGLSDIVRCVGLVPHDQVPRYYSIMDVLVYPRIDARINQTVTPLKPLEAIAMGKVCLASDVEGLRELVIDGITGMLFRRDDAKDLAAKILMVEADSELRDRLSEQGQAAVRKEREWSEIASRYAEVYRRAGAQGIHDANRS